MPNSRDVRILAEHNLLAALLVLKEPDYIREVSSIIYPKDFHDWNFVPPFNQHFRIFVAMQALAAQRTTVNQVTVAQKLYESIDESHGGDMGHREVSDIAEMSGIVSELECSLDYMEYAKTVSKLANPIGTKKNCSTVPILRG